MRRKTIIKGNAQRELNPLAPRITAIIEHLDREEEEEEEETSGGDRTEEGKKENGCLKRGLEFVK